MKIFTNWLQGNYWSNKNIRTCKAFKKKQSFEWSLQLDLCMHFRPSPLVMRVNEWLLVGALMTMSSTRAGWGVRRFVAWTRLRWAHRIHHYRLGPFVVCNSLFLAYFRLYQNIFSRSIVIKIRSFRLLLLLLRICHFCRKIDECTGKIIILKQLDQCK